MFLAGEAQHLEQILRAVGIVARRQSARHIVEHGGGRTEIGFLRQVADRAARLDEALARIRLDHAGGDLQERRLAGTVAADEADAVSFPHLEFGRGEQRRAAEGERDVAEVQ